MATAPARLELIALPDFPLVEQGDDLAGLVMDGLARASLGWRDGDVVVLAQKIVSKAEGRLVDLATVEPSPEAQALAAQVLKDPRLVELVLRESRRVVRARPHVLIVEHRLGLIMANAGIDQSNVEAGGRELALLLPQDPDASAEGLRARLQAVSGAAVGVVINDSFGRPWRRGTTGVAIGAAGLPALVDRRGEPDLFGRALQVTMIGFADEIAATASLLMGQADEGRPVVLIRGLRWSAPPNPAAELMRPESEDLFR
ncbi:coenzyme F420-0:L-glutamate ligase/coenzyme F420-1:gamma-L-glutamate ligase [Ancylobacter aquaticus]|uniref:Coenzyme F420-0:L-glutamate ligase/coenzyme F420-1:gamma-L-glutamate ligase n=1 Tax=Ancylobacter aquaticus TaxID=100 RepID=A0A4R1IB65_ANCAQ|nr:coenzyme F420-0:L-glutamate ligase [Ancylobacter aquaticus]TCK30920.1 coenzyme F420-0:L-glutamate ligase/coenzyme F420-1:gamma-L-glutamate ligase [Ancylobacter aquaticus]